MASQSSQPSDSQVSDSVSNAALATSILLTSLQKPHAIIGGQAIRMLGSGRKTRDVDIIVAEPVEGLRNLMIERDSRFSINNKQQLLFNSGNNYLVPVELLHGGPGLALALPSAQNSEKVHQAGAYILHPATLIITKVKRWVHIADSDRPQSMSKARTDELDISFLIDWLFRNSSKVNFTEYATIKPKQELLAYFKKLYRSLVPNEQAQLRAILDPEDYTYVSS